MSKRKLYCILEQSGETPSKEAFERKRMFSTDFSDHFRINWKTPDDDLSAGYYPGITWSEGRSVLYEIVRGKYEYVIFIDDDIQFVEGDKDVAELIAKDLQTYAPVTGTFYDRSSWAFKSIDPSKALSKPCFPIHAFDLQTFIMKNDFASMMMPVPFHGFDKSMWYAQYICSELWPEKQMAFSSPEVRNTRHVQHIDDGQGTHPLHGDFLFWRFSKLSAKNHKIPAKLDQNELQEMNASVIEKTISIAPLTASDETLSTILNISHRDYTHRKPIIGYDYSLRNSLYYYRWKLTYGSVQTNYRLWRKKMSSNESIKRLNKYIGRH